MNHAASPTGNFSPHLLARYVAGALFVVVAAGSWDVWWHGAVGRDSFWEPPHILLQVGVLGTLIGAAYGWVRSRERRWKFLALAALVVPISAPFDELWHRALGVESVSSPLIIWSPPHLALVGSLTAAVLLVLPLLRTDGDEIARVVFMSLAFASLLVLALFLAVPLEPLGPYHLLGFAGTVARALFLAFVLLMARTLIPAVGAATMTMAFFLTLNSLTFGEQLAPGVTVPPHAHPPVWLSVFSFAVAAVLADAVKDRWHPSIAGALIGSLSAGILYGLAPAFLEPSFRYGATSAGLALVAAILGGGVGGLLGARAARILRRVSP